MSSTEEFYREFWHEFSTSKIGPQKYTSDTPVKKNNNEGYRQFNWRFACGFRLVVTAGLQKDRLGAEFFTGGGKLGRAFIESLDQAGKGIRLKGGALARVHLTNSTDAKVELLWLGANLQDRTFWPAHFAWLRIATNELAETLTDAAEQFESKNC